MYRFWAKSEFRFEFRDALDPHGFHSLSRQTQAVSPNASQQSSLLPSDQRIASLNSHNDASASSTLRSAQFTPQPPNSKPRIEGMSEVHQRENRKLRPKGRQFKFEDPCSRCGLPLGKIVLVFVLHYTLPFLSS